MRARVRDWLNQLGVARADAEDLVLACSEACANSVEHAPALPGPNALVVRGTLLADSIVKLTVRDYGRWHFAPRTPEEPQRYDAGDEPGGLKTQPASHSGHDIVVIGASAGGVGAIAGLVRSLPADLPAAVFVVLHVMSTGTSVLPEILLRERTLPAAHAVDGEHVEHGRIYVAPPDLHLLVERGRVRLSRDAKENGHRPAIDTLFRSAARAYESRVVGVVLSGVLDDGSAGLLRVNLHGGATIAQDPEDALYAAMSQNAIDHVQPDLDLPLADIGPALVELAGRPPSREILTIAPNDPVAGDPGSLDPQPGKPSGFTCPDGAGALWESEEGEILRFRCRVGHQFSTESLFAEQAEGVDAALWGGLRALEERVALNRRLEERMRSRGQARNAERFERRAQESERNAALLRDLLHDLQSPRDVADDVDAGAGRR